MSQDTEVPTDYSWGRFSKSLKMDVTTADTSVSTNHAITLQYRMEDKILEIVVGIIQILIQFCQFLFGQNHRKLALIA